jgi:hypothetical protein
VPISAVNAFVGSKVLAASPQSEGMSLSRTTGSVGSLARIAATACDNVELGRRRVHPVRDHAFPLMYDHKGLAAELRAGYGSVCASHVDVFTSKRYEEAGG